MPDGPVASVNAEHSVHGRGLGNEMMGRECSRGEDVVALSTMRSELLPTSTTVEDSGLWLDQF